MMLVCLCEKHHPQVPVALVDKRLGFESVVDPCTKQVLAIGESVRLVGPAEEIRQWLALAGKIWVSLDPATGRWDVMQVESEQGAKA